MDSYFVYILASKRNGTLYTGFTSDLLSRIYTHRNDLVKGFTKKYGVHMLVYYETCDGYEAPFNVKNRLKNGKGSGN